MGDLLFVCRKERSGVQGGSAGELSRMEHGMNVFRMRNKLTGR